MTWPEIHHIVGMWLDMCLVVTPFVLLPWLLFMTWRENRQQREDGEE
jgi:hypothetical protein